MPESILRSLDWNFVVNLGLHVVILDVSLFTWSFQSRLGRAPAASQTESVDLIDPTLREDDSVPPSMSAKSRLRLGHKATLVSIHEFPTIMSPIPLAVTAFTVSPATPSVPPESVPAGQSASAVPYHLGTGGLVFCAVAIVSIASYFYHKRGTADGARTNNTRIPFSSFLSNRRHRSSEVTPAAATTAHQSADPESNPDQHVSMIYARFFHPTFWNLVECHPPTPSAPAIYIEDEAREIPVSESKPYGMTSFLDVDDEDEDKRVSEKLGRGARHQVERLPPYDASSPTNVNFSSEIIGVTVRSGAFLSVPGEYEDDSSEDPSDSELNFSCSAGDGSLVTPPRSSPGTRALDVASSDPEDDSPLSARDEVPTTSPRSPCRDRRYGLADMTNFASSLQGTIPEEADNLGPTNSHHKSSFDVCKSVDVDSATSDRSLNQPEPLDDESTNAYCNLDIQASCDGSGNSLNDPDTHTAPLEGVDLMRKLLDALRDPDLDCNPRRALSEATESDYGPGDGDEVTDPYRTHPLASTSFSPRSESSDEGPISPVTPPPVDMSTTTLTKVSYVHHVRKWLLAPTWFNEKVQIVSPTSSDVRPSCSSSAKAHVRTRKEGRSLRALAPWAA